TPRASRPHTGSARTSRSQSKFRKDTVCRVPYLGYILTPGRVEMDPDKVRDALKIPTPDRVININNAKPQSLRKLVHIFLGLIGFYRVFIKDYATLASTLYDLTCTNTTPVWLPIHEKAWNA